MKKKIDFMEQLLTSVLVKFVDFNLGAYALFILLFFFSAGGISIWCGGFQCESINLLDYWKHISCDVSLITTFQYLTLIYIYDHCQI